jgi:Tfp pilus assembly protein PilV
MDINQKNVSRAGGLKTRPVSQFGMALMEVMLAVAILSVAILGTLGAVSYGARGGQHGSNVADATNYARTLLDLCDQEGKAYQIAAADPSAARDSSGYNDSDTTTRELNAPPFNSLSYGLPTGTRFKRNIQIDNYKTPADSAANWKATIRQVTVTVSWFDAGQPRKVVVKGFSRAARG